MDCIFCKIIKGEVPAHKVYEDEHALAFLDINPNSVGHTLVIPKTHFEDIFALSEEVIPSLFEAVQKVAAAVKQATKADGINIAMNNGKAAGQDVFHSHFHIIPRHEGDWKVHHQHVKYAKGQAEETSKKIASSLL